STNVSAPTSINAPTERRHPELINNRRSRPGHPCRHQAGRGLPDWRVVVSADAFAFPLRFLGQVARQVNHLGRRPARNFHKAKAFQFSSTTFDANTMDINVASRLVW